MSEVDKNSVGVALLRQSTILEQDYCETVLTLSADMFNDILAPIKEVLGEPSPAL